MMAESPTNAQKPQVTRIETKLPTLDAAELLTTSEVARLLHLCTWTVKHWRRRGQGPPFIRLGTRSIRYSRLQLLVYLDRRVQGRILPEKKEEAAEELASKSKLLQ